MWYSLRYILSVDSLPFFNLIYFNKHGCIQCVFVEGTVYYKLMIRKIFISTRALWNQFIWIIEHSSNRVFHINTLHCYIFDKTYSVFIATVSQCFTDRQQQKKHFLKLSLCFICNKSKRVLLFFKQYWIKKRQKHL